MHTFRFCRLVCPRCGGTGKNQGETCYYCQGEGKVNS